MEAYAKSISKILHSSDQFLIPFFQRFYKWGRKDWERLRADLWALMDDERDRKHFLGPLVCTAEGVTPGEVTAFQLIDGQQRLTTLSLLLCALRDVARQQGEEELAARIEENFLIHKFEKKLRRYKIVPRTGDREAFIAIVDGKELDREAGLQIVAAYDFFRKHIQQLAQTAGGEGLANLFQKATGGLYLVVITIDEENPYEIFESLNSTGLPLAESDLIRNFLFMHVPQDDQEDFQEDHWEPYEALFDATDKHDALKPTDFYRSFLMRGGTYSQPKSTFLDFKEYFRQRGWSPVDQVAELARFAKLECQLRRPDTVTDAALAKRLRSVAAMEINTSHPLLLNLLARHEEGVLPMDGLLGCLDDLCSFVLRRSICGESTRTYGKWFCEAITAIKDNPRSDLQGYWQHRGWPDDRALQTALVEFPVYRREPKKCRLILEELERDLGHKERVDPTTLSIEHVMPQTLSGKSSKEWKEALGTDWKSLHERWLHTLGNLTLSGYNGPMSNHGFATKREELTRSNVSLNRHFTDHDKWDAAAIEQRGRKLSETVTGLWPRPEGGPAYVPPSKERKLKAGVERRTAYWSDLLAILKEKHGWKDLPEATGETRLELPLGVDGASLYAWYKVGGKQLWAAVVLPPGRGRRHFRNLVADRAAIDKELGFMADWNDAGRSVGAMRKNSSIKDPLDWLEQHEWLASKLTTVRRVLAPRIEQLASSEDSEDDSGETSREYWRGRSTDEALGWCDQIKDLIDEVGSRKHDLVYRVHNIAVKPADDFFNVVSFYPRKRSVWMSSGSSSLEQWANRFADAGFETSVKRKGRLGVRLTQEVLDAHRELISDYLRHLVETAKTKNARSDELVAFWQAFVERMQQHQTPLTPQSPRGQAWMNFAIGRSDAWLHGSVNSVKNRASVGLGLRGAEQQAVFQALYADRDRISQEIGGDLEWLGDPERKSLRIYLRNTQIDVRDHSNWPELHDWMIEKLGHFHCAFVPRLSRLG
ncbi:hypothetical protein Pla123a_45970 [Posidoniimonas polymericola]|uniref:DUF4268 domain-containing protein n=1 Tax=Posidoniimonas polymericola TaxID=2528002 RepID=A0A5C5XW07_9BACT|nr:DUF4268 domain-containing protein [Posidoniimonas polymericola]TWT66711.1 hypothetical protein Pla123a_45970 [Posidoniimonas polymericola]